jgi:prevent-host-death family protein
MASLPKQSAKNGERVGIREFRQNIAKYVLESDAPVVLTRHGDEVGYFIPLRRPKRTEEEKEAFRKAGEEVQKMLADAGLDGDEIVRDFQRWRKAQRKR